MRCPCCGQDAPDGAIPDLTFAGGMTYYKGRAIPIFRAEARLLAMLVKKGGQVLTRTSAWNESYAMRPPSDDIPDPKIFDVYISRLRKFLRQANVPLKIETVWGRGWRAEKTTHFIDETTDEDYYANVQ